MSFVTTPQPPKRHHFSATDVCIGADKHAASVHLRHPPPSPLFIISNFHSLPPPPPLSFIHFLSDSHPFTTSNSNLHFGRPRVMYRGRVFFFCVVSPASVPVERWCAYVNESTRECMLNSTRIHQAETLAPRRANCDHHNHPYLIDVAVCGAAFSPPILTVR